MTTWASSKTPPHIVEESIVADTSQQPASYSTAECSTHHGKETKNEALQEDEEQKKCTKERKKEKQSKTQMSAANATDQSLNDEQTYGLPNHNSDIPSYSQQEPANNPSSSRAFDQNMPCSSKKVAADSTEHFPRSSKRAPGIDQNESFSRKRRKPSSNDASGDDESIMADISQQQTNATYTTKHVKQKEKDIVRDEEPTGRKNETKTDEQSTSQASSLQAEEMTNKSNEGDDTHKTSNQDVDVSQQWPFNSEFDRIFKRRSSREQDEPAAQQREAMTSTRNRRPRINQRRNRPGWPSHFGQDEPCSSQKYPQFMEVGQRLAGQLQPVKNEQQTSEKQTQRPTQDDRKSRRLTPKTDLEKSSGNKNIAKFATDASTSSNQLFIEELAADQERPSTRRHNQLVIRDQPQAELCSSSETSADVSSFYERQQQSIHNQPLLNKPRPTSRRQKQSYSENEPTFSQSAQKFEQDTHCSMNSANVVECMPTSSKRKPPHQSSPREQQALQKEPAGSHENLSNKKQNPQFVQDEPNAVTQASYFDQTKPSSSKRFSQFTEDLSSYSNRKLSFSKTVPSSVQQKQQSIQNEVARPQQAPLTVREKSPIFKIPEIPAKYQKLCKSIKQTPVHSQASTTANIPAPSLMIDSTKEKSSTGKQNEQFSQDNSTVSTTTRFNQDESCSTKIITEDAQTSSTGKPPCTMDIPHSCEQVPKSSQEVPVVSDEIEQQSINDAEPTSTSTSQQVQQTCQQREGPISGQITEKKTTKPNDNQPFTIVRRTNRPDPRLVRIKEKVLGSEELALLQEQREEAWRAQVIARFLKESEVTSPQSIISKTSPSHQEPAIKRETCETDEKMKKDNNNKIAQRTNRPDPRLVRPSKNVLPLSETSNIHQALKTEPMKQSRAEKLLGTHVIAHKDKNLDALLTIRPYPGLRCIQPLSSDQHPQKGKSTIHQTQKIKPLNDPRTGKVLETHAIAHKDKNLADPLTIRPYPGLRCIQPLSSDQHPQKGKSTIHQTQKIKPLNDPRTGKVLETHVITEKEKNLADLLTIRPYPGLSCIQPLSSDQHPQKGSPPFTKRRRSNH